MGVNQQLGEMLAEPGYYQDVRHSHDYIMATWTRYFDVVEIVLALACFQDLVVLRARCA